MKIQDRMTLKLKITEIALNEALRGWQAPNQGPLHCPFCQSDLVSRRMQRKNGMIYNCKNCSQPFSEELIRLCHCARPGILAKCQTCPQYQRIREMMKFNIEQLRHLPEVEVDKIISHPDFYHEQFSLQQFLPQIKLRHYSAHQTKDRSATPVLEQPPSVAGGNQLSLFE